MSLKVEPASLQIVHYPHPTLRHPSKPVRRVDGELVAIVRRMFELMYAADGVGLAANQVDLPLRLFVANVAARPDQGQELVFINPVLSRPKGREEADEGCLSLPQLYAPVTRAKSIQVQAYTLDGQELNTELDGLLARIVQHENDHLDGVVFPDRVSTAAKLDIEPDLDEFEFVFHRRQQRSELPSNERIEQSWYAWEKRYC